ncbi:alpha/beta hydrolase [soil metagenome]
MFGIFVMAGLMLSYVLTHTARAVVPAPELGAPHENVAFTTSEGLRLQGWYVPSKNRAAVIVFPGRKGPQRQTRMLVRHGYGVLLFDRRGEGVSEGDPNVFGWAGTTDLKAAIAFLHRRPDVDRQRIGGIGLSVGAEMLLQAAAETPDLAAVVSEGAGIRSVREATGLGWGKPLEITVSAAATVGTALFGNDLPPPSLEALVPRIAPRPVFFIYATHGQGGENLNPQFHSAAREPKELWEITVGKHTGGITAVPAEYERRVVGFLDRALLRNP